MGSLPNIDTDLFYFVAATKLPLLRHDRKKNENLWSLHSVSSGEARTPSFKILRFFLEKMLSCLEQRTFQVPCLRTYFSCFSVAISSCMEAIKWAPSWESPFLDRIPFLPLISSVTYTRCLNFSEPWLLNFSATVLSPGQDCEAGSAVNPRLSKHPPKWLAPGRCPLNPRCSRDETDSVTGPSFAPRALRTKSRIFHRAALKVFKSIHLLPEPSLHFLLQACRLFHIC